FDHCVLELKPRGLTRTTGGYLAMQGYEMAAVRGASAAGYIRPARHVPPVELGHAVFNVVRDAQAVSRQELLVHVARLFGWGRSGSEIRLVLEDTLDDLIDRNRLTQDANGQVTAGT
ncbi:MAG: hypothetical protein ACRDZY_18105, partial [Acidimicrobiales bacterium]